MGQRLNIEIVSGETSLANCYYHWSAYTISALLLTKAVIDAYTDYDPDINHGLQMAIDLLESTGAGINEAEKREIQKQPNTFGHLKFKDCVSRNSGLLAVTENGKEEIRELEEGRVTIDLAAETFCFDVLCKDSFEDYVEYYWDERQEEIQKQMFFDEAAFEKLPECPFDLCSVPFDKVDALIDFVESNRCARDGEMVLTWVE